MTKVNTPEEYAAKQAKKISSGKNQGKRGGKNKHINGMLPSPTKLRAPGAGYTSTNYHKEVTLMYHGFQAISAGMESIITIALSSSRVKFQCLDDILASYSDYREVTRGSSSSSDMTVGGWIKKELLDACELVECNDYNEVLKVADACKKAGLLGKSYELTYLKPIESGHTRLDDATAHAVKKIAEEEPTEPEQQV